MPHRVRRDQAVTWILAAGPIPAGLVIALFNDRFTSRSWRFAGGMPGGYTTWSGVLLACGVLMFAALVTGRFTTRRRANREALLIAGMFLVGVWWFLLGGMFLVTALIDPLANPLGVTAWWLICAIYWTWAWYERQRV